MDPRSIDKMMERVDPEQRIRELEHQVATLRRLLDDQVGITAARELRDALEVRKALAA